jgi:K+-sensing histidine kinase KdpD
MNQMTQHRKSTTIIVSFVLIVLIGLLDHLTGYELGFFVFYFIPISYAAWLSGRVFGVIVSVISALTWFLVDATTALPYSSPWYGVWNAGIRLVSFLIIAITVSKVKEVLTSERELSAQLQEALNQVKELRGLLPICASCKKIRNDQGYWEQIEAYVSRHSKAEFSHGICPECAKRLYPELFTDKRTSEPSHSSQRGLEVAKD